MQKKKQTRKRFLILCLLWGFLGLQIVFVLPANSAQLREIQRRGNLIVAVKDNLRPLGFRDDQGNLQGLEIDLAQRLAQDLFEREDAVALQSVGNNDRLAAITSGRVDLAIAHLTATASRSRLVEFSIPYYADGTSLVSKTLGNIREIDNQQIAVLEGSSTLGEIKYRFPQARIINVPSYQAAKDLLDRNGAIAFAGDTSVLTGWVQTYPDYKLFPHLELRTNDLAIAMPKGLQYQELHQQVNNALLRYQQEKWLLSRVQYWGLPE